MIKIAVLLIIPIVACAGTISGQLIYPSGGIGAYGVAALSPSVISDLISGSGFDFMALPHALLYRPGSYSINDTSIVDSIPFEVFGVKVPGTSIPNYGDPMGMYDEPVYTVGGIATNINVTLGTIGTIFGTVSYSGGSLDNVKLQILTVDMVASSLFTEKTVSIDSSEYSVSMYSGFHVLLFFDDKNSNGVYDTLVEPANMYMGDWGPLIFTGSGSRFSTDINVFLISDVQGQKNRPNSIELACYPNPFNTKATVSYHTESNGIVTVRDITGKLLNSYFVSGNGEITIGDGLESSIYIISIISGHSRKDILVFVVK